MRILFIGDLVGRSGRSSVMERLPGLMQDWRLDFVVINGENAAGGFGITEAIYRDLIEVGADAITLGNHAFRRSEIGPYLEASERVIRPANASLHAPGRGLVVVPTANGARLAVINVLGSLFLHPATSMFELIDDLVEAALRETSPWCV